jgi:hypothetical protein
MNINLKKKEIHFKSSSIFHFIINDEILFCFFSTRMFCITKEKEKEKKNQQKDYLFCSQKM